MKVGIDLKYVRKGARGGNLGDEMAQRNLLRYLATVDGDNQYILYVNRDVDVEPLQAHASRNVSLKRMPYSHRNRILRNLVWLPRELRRNPVDLFHGSASLPLLSHPGRNVMTMWEFSPLIFPEYFPAHVRVTRGVVYRKGVREADRVITGTHFMRAQISAFFGIREDKISVVRIGVDERFLQRATKEEIERAKRAHDIEGGYLLSVGDLYPKKNIGGLIAAVNLLKSRRQMQETLVVVGSPLWKTAALKTLDLRHVVFTGFVPDRDLLPLYQGARAFIFPSKYEGFGIPVLEAMASGVPMALSDNTSFPEIAGDAAIYFDPFDVESIAAAIQTLLDDRQLQARLLARAEQRIREFRWEHIVRQYCQLYSAMCP